MVGYTESGPNTPTVRDRCMTMDEYINKYAFSGRNDAASALSFDSAETFFREGGSALYVQRVTGDAAAASAGTIEDSAAGVVADVEANGVGSWGDLIKLVIETDAENPNIAAGAWRVLVVRVADDKILEASYDLESKVAMVVWADTSQYIRMEGGASNLDPEVGDVLLTGGDGDPAGVDDTAWDTAFASLDKDLGPGLVFAPGGTTDIMHGKLAVHANQNARVAIADLPDSPDETVLITSGKAIIDDTGKRSRFTGPFGPWITIAGLTLGTSRKIPPSPAIAGVFSRNMSGGASANQPAAGEMGRLRTPLALSQTYSNDAREALNAQGCNIIREVFGVIKVYGWRTSADPINDPRWINLSNSILHRQIIALANAVGERFIFRQIDGQGLLVAEFGGSLVGEVLHPLYLEGALYGESPAGAYSVNVGPQVNTPATIANNELHAVMSVRMSPFSEQVDIEVVKYLVTEAIPA